MSLHLRLTIMIADVLNYNNIFFKQDVRYDLFHKDYIRGGSEPERKDGLRICQMLSNPNKGKVHITEPACGRLSEGGLELVLFSLIFISTDARSVGNTSEKPFT